MDVQRQIARSAISAATRRTVWSTGTGGSVFILIAALLWAFGGKSAEEHERQARRQRKIDADGERKLWRAKWYHPDGTPRDAKEVVAPAIVLVEEPVVVERDPEPEAGWLLKLIVFGGLACGVIVAISYAMK